MSNIVVSPKSIVNNFLLFQKDTLQFLIEAMPLGDVVLFKTGNFKPSYVINAPHFIQEILVTKDAAFRKGRSSNVLRRTIGDGLLTSEAEHHQGQRAMMMPVFYKERIRQYGNIMIEETQRMVDRWQNGQVIGITEEMMKLTLSIITRTMFGEEISEQRKQQVADAVNVTIARSAQLLYSPIQMPFFVPTKGNRMHREALQTLDQLVDEILDRLEQDTQKYENTLIGLLYAVRDQAGQPLPRSEIRDQMVTMLIAGHETTANALSWAWYALSHHPQQIQAIRDELAELKQMLQASAGHDVDSIERYKALRYTQAVVQETLRLYPPAWLILREAQEDVEILGETFVKGSSMLISPYALHRNEQVFTDPLSFRPERFLSGQQYPRFTYFPFGGGSRSCIGSTFALMEATLVLAEMVQRLHLESDPQTTPTPETSVSLRMKQELPMTVRMWS